MGGLKMKATHRSIIITCLISLSFVGCSKIVETEVDEQEVIDSREWSVRIEAIKGASKTKALTEEENDIKATWTAGDQIHVKLGDDFIGDLQAESDGQTTTLVGNVTTSLIKVGDTLTLTYLSPNYKDQRGTLSSIASCCDYAVAKTTVASVNDAEGTFGTGPALFENQQSITKISFAKGEIPFKPASVTISSESGLLITDYENGSPVYGEIQFDYNGEDPEVFVALCSDCQDTDTFTFIVSDANEVLSGTKRALLQKGKYYETQVLLSREGPEAVDLGLSVMWASYNLGASSPTEVGNRYAWGEVKPKSSFSLAGYKWLKGAINTLIKYNRRPILGYNGFADSKSILEPQDDAAHVEYAGKWRMPTREECEELINNCTWQSTNVNSMTGYWATSKINGNRIFIPTPNEQVGNYWTSSEGSEYYSNSNSNSFPDGSAFQASSKIYNVRRTVLDISRWNGLMIRPVWGDGIRLDKKRLELCVGGSQQLHVSYFPSSASNQDVLWSSDKPAVAVVSSDGTVSGIAVGTATITATTASNGTSVSCLVTIIKAPEYVDLGLSVKWGTLDLGASSPEKDGDVYAWGECEKQTTVEGYTDSYSWRTYKWNDATDSSLTKYCTDAYYGKNGFVDNKWTLDLEDDVAYARLGGKWRMPSADEINELNENCTTKSITVNGVSALQYISKINGNSIILRNPNGYSLRSSTLSVNNPSMCFVVQFSDVYASPRCAGSHVRPVYDEETSCIRVQSIELDKTTLEMRAGQSAILHVSFTPENPTQTGVTWSSSKTSIATVSDDGLVIAKSAGEAIITAQSVDGKISSTCSVSVIGAEYVDLGLSVKWGTANLGAYNPENEGEYFAWGETASKESYTWETYKWSKDDTELLTKYCSDSYKGYNGFTDNKAQLDNSDDVVKVRLGGSWRMPTYDEITELRDNCTITSSSLNGEDGFVVKSKVNGNSIFIPRWTGRISGTNLTYTSPCLWSSSVSSGIYSSYISFQSSGMYVSGMARNVGLNVRPVME